MLDPTSKQDPVVPDVKGCANGEYGAWLAGSRKEDVGDKNGGCSSFHIDQNATNHIVLTFFLLSSAAFPCDVSMCCLDGCFFDTCLVLALSRKQSTRSDTTDAASALSVIDNFCQGRT